MKRIKRPVVLFYSSVKTKKMFSIQQYYKTDITILKELGYKVLLSNSFLDYFFFWRYDISFIYFYRYGLLPAFLSRMFFKPVIFTGGIDDLNVEYSGKKKYYLQKLFFNLCAIFASKIILVSNSDRNLIKKFKKKLNPNKYHLSFHVVDFEKYEYSFSLPKEKLITTIAWMVRKENIFRKGVDKAVKAFMIFHKLAPEFKMIIIGPKGEGSEIIENIIEENGYQDHIILTGAIKEKQKIDILKKSKYYLQLSSYEGFGIAAIEALASGNIVLHSGQGGLKDGVGHWGVTIDEISNYELISKKISSFEGRESTKKVIESGIEHVRRNFIYEKRFADFKRILNQIYK